MWKVYSSLSKSYLVTQKKYEAQFSSYMPIQTLYWNSLNAEKKKKISIQLPSMKSDIKDICQNAK